MTPEKLMTYAENKYNIMMRDKVWNTLSPDQEKIVALSSTVQELKDSNLKLAKAFQASQERIPLMIERARILTCGLGRRPLQMRRILKLKLRKRITRLTTALSTIKCGPYIP